MAWYRQKETLSKINLILSLVGILLVIAPVIMLGILYLYSESSTDIVMFLGMLLTILTIPMTAIVFVIYIAVGISSIIMLNSKVCITKNVTALTISIIALVASSIGLFQYFNIGLKMLDTISRLG